MRLHRVGDQADWRYVKPANYNIWQRLAAATKGWLTPGNVLSIGGLVLVAAGTYLIVRDSYAIGFATLIIGRLADLADGVVADMTKTKSPLGELIDVSCDKLALVIVLPAFALEELLPLAVIAVILAQNLLVWIISIIAKSRAVVLHPSRSGKLSVAASWAVVSAFLLSNILPDAGWQSLQEMSLAGGYVLFAVFIVLGWAALFTYGKELDRQQADRRATANLDFAKILLIMNPASSHAARIRARARELQRLFPTQQTEVIETTKDSKAFRRKLTRQLTGNAKPTLICIGGGDGTVHLILNILMELSAKTSLDTITLLPLWGGNANDFAYMLNGQSSLVTLKSLFADARVVPIHPFEITIASPGHPPQIRYAACYASFGASAYATDQLDHPTPAQKLANRSAASRFMSEVIRTIKALLDAPGFDIELRGERVKIFEHAFINGSRMAKFDRLPVKLNEKNFYRALRPEQEPIFMFYMSLLQIFKRRGSGEVTDQPQTFTTEQKIWAQFDGEASEIPAHTTITVRHAPHPFYALSKKLKP